MGCRLVLASLTILLVGSLQSVQAQHAPRAIAEIVVEGNTRTARSVVDRIVGLSPGDPFDVEVLDQVWDRLEDCGYFAFVDLDYEENEDGRIMLLITVEEEETFRLAPSLRYDRRHKYLLGLSATDTNLRGRGETLRFAATLLYLQRAEATWTRPWWLNRDGLDLTVNARWEQGRFVWQPFDYMHWWTHAAMRQQITGVLFAEFSTGFESFRQKDETTKLVGTTVQTFPAETRNTWLLRGLVGADTRDNPFYSTSGLLMTYEWAYRDFADIDAQHDQRLDLRGFVPLPGKPLLALRALGQAVSNVRADEYALRWGGPETVRGATYAGREGDRGYLCTAELRWPWKLMPVAVTGEVIGVGLHAFTDLGDAWYDDANRALWSYGAGAHLNLLSYQLRFEAAKERDGDWTFEFMDVFNF